MYIQLGISLKAGRIFVQEQGLNSPDHCMFSLTRMSLRFIMSSEIQVVRSLATAQENLKLPVFLFHHRWRCTCDLELKMVQEDTVHKLVGQKKLIDEYKDPDMLSSWQG